VKADFYQGEPDAHTNPKVEPLSPGFIWGGSFISVVPIKKGLEQLECWNNRISAKHLPCVGHHMWNFFEKLPQYV